MKIWLGVTDNDWFNFLSKKNLEEVNFWRPKPDKFHAIQEGDLFLFKLKSPHNHIAGGGIFSGSYILDVVDAWKLFGEANGTRDFDQLLRKISEYKSTNSKDLKINCLIVNNVFYIPKNSWIDVSSFWGKSIVRGKTLDRESDQAKWILSQLNAPIWDDNDQSENIYEDSPKYGNIQLVKPRLGQGSFRLKVADAYNHRCAITGENTAPVLEAAHIKPYSISQDHSVGNGILLRSDFHILFDRGLVGVTNELKVAVSPQINEKWFNGKNYYRLHGEKLQSIPSNSNSIPNKEHLDWHYNNVFQK